MNNILNKIINYSLYLLVFLFPLWFLPWTNFPVVLNKQMLLSVFVFLLLIFWLIKIIASGKLSLTWGKLPAIILLFILALSISTALSSSKIQSFWGMSFEPDTLFSFILYSLIFFLFANLISINQLSSVLISFLAGSGILALLFLVQIFKPIFPWDFTQSPGFNPIGSVQALAVFLGGAFLILVALLTTGNSASNQRLAQRKIGGILLGLLLFSAIFLINFWVVWLGIIFGMVIIIFSILKNFSGESASTSAPISGPAEQGNPLKPLFLPLFIFVLALVFIFLKLPIGNIISLPSEISPTYKATFDIATETLKESPKNLILGSGQATFGYQYSLHRGTGPNLTDFWQIRFDQGTPFLLTILTTSGVLGLLAILMMITIFFWQGLKTLIYTDKKRMDTDKNRCKSVFSSVSIRETQLAAFTGGFYFLISWFFYSGVSSLFFVSFLMLGLWQASISGNQRINQRVISVLFTQSPQKAFSIMLVCVILIVGSILGLYNISQKYAGAVIYAKGLSLINATEPKLNEGIIKINKAAQLDQKDSYFRNLSQAFLFKINEVLNNQELTQEQRQKLFQQIVSNAEMSANNAALINPRNSQNWLQLGNVYENFAVVNVEGAAELSVTSYEKAQELDPQNPLIPFNIARVYFRLDQKETAKQYLEKSLQLKADFQPATDLLKQIETKSEE